MQTVRKGLHRVYFLMSTAFLPAFSKPRKDRDAAADDVLHVDFSAHAVLFADDDAGVADVFETRVFNPKLVEVPRIDRDSRWHILEVWTNECQTGFMFANGGFGLAV